jgi:hypothetical protein
MHARACTHKSRLAAESSVDVGFTSESCRGCHRPARPLWANSRHCRRGSVPITSRSPVLPRRGGGHLEAIKPSFCITANNLTTLAPQRITPASLSPRRVLMGRCSCLSRSRSDRDFVDSGGKRSGDPKAKVIAPKKRGVPEAVRGVEDDWRKIPGTAMGRTLLTGAALDPS